MEDTVSMKHVETYLINIERAQTIDLEKVDSIVQEDSNSKKQRHDSDVAKELIPKRITRQNS